MEAPRALLRPDSHRSDQSPDGGSRGVPAGARLGAAGGHAVTPDQAWETAARRLEGFGIPRDALCKGCLAEFELADIVAAWPRGSPVRILEIGSFVGLTACALA